jgi:nicotinate-nucleotide--dimethylbenzimidazole phosphoribosyltransferase
MFFRGTISADGTRIEGVFLDAHGNVLGATPQTETPAPAAPLQTAVAQQQPPVAQQQPVEQQQPPVAQQQPSQTAQTSEASQIAQAPQTPKTVQGAGIAQTQAPQIPQTPNVAPSPDAQPPQVPPSARGARAPWGIRFGRIPQGAQFPAADAETPALVKAVLRQHGARFARVTDFRSPRPSAEQPLGANGSASAPAPNASPANASPAGDLSANAPAATAPAADAPAANAPAAETPVAMPERADDGSSVVAEADDRSRGGASMSGSAPRWGILPTRAPRSPRSPRHAPPRGTVPATRRSRSWTKRAGAWSLPSGP